MTKILPPGSTSDDLQAAVDTSASGDTVVLTGDMPFAGTVVIPTGLEITVQSDTGNNWVMSKPGSLVRHFKISGDLFLQNITLDGGGVGGGAQVTGGSLTVNDGTVIQKCLNSNGGSIFVSQDGTFTVNGGVIRENTATGAGAGVMFQQGHFIMTGGEFLDNTAAASGGAIQMLGSCTVAISGGNISGNAAGFQGGGIGIPVGTSASISNVTISGNTAKYNGGGVFIQGSATMSGVTVSDNTANVRGGGIYVYSGGKIELADENYIIRNNAPDGGGIYTANSAYSNLVSGSETVFRCNWASTAHQPPVDAHTLYPEIKFASTSIADHPLNNFDINYSAGQPVDIFFSVTYDANGGTGSYIEPGIIPGRTDTVLSPTETGISRANYTFAGWNTQPDGKGAEYKPGDIITVGCSIVLFARWIAAELRTVTYTANGGSGSYSDRDRQYGSSYTVLSSTQTGIDRPGFTLSGWNTQPDGKGIPLMPGDIITLTDDLTLFAQWQHDPAPTPVRRCRTPNTRCRTSIEGQKIWIDNNNAGKTRPPFVEIILLRDSKEYKRTNVDSAGDGYFCFCCVPICKNSNHIYNYQIDEVVPTRYTKKIEGYNVINTLNP